MTLAAPERLLAEFVAAPAALAVADPDAVQVLLARGHPLVADASGRWRLACAAVHFDPERFARQRQSALGGSFEVWERLGSTNERAWEVAAAGAAAGSLVLAEEQASGRGRQGRTWDCPAHAGLLFSLLLHASLRDNPRPQLLPLALALGAAEGLRQATGQEVQLAWPNDLVLPAGSSERSLRKVGGILLETRAELPATVVAGCGLNVRVAADFFAVRGLHAAASLAPADAFAMGGASGAAPAADGSLPELPREDLLAAVLAGVEQRCHDWQERRWPGLLQAWEALDALQGLEVEVQRGVERCRGRARGITPAGLLELELPEGTRCAFAAGEVHLQ